MAMSSFQKLVPFRIEVAAFPWMLGIEWLLIVVCSIGCFWSVLDGNGRFCSELWIDFSSSALI